LKSKSKIAISIKILIDKVMNSNKMKKLINFINKTQIKYNNKLKFIKLEND
jgi:hypothetical protein